MGEREGEGERERERGGEIKGERGRGRQFGTRPRVEAGFCESESRTL